MVIASFLPLYESPRFARIESNTLIQQGGWLLVLVALGIAVTGYRLDQGQSKSATPSIVLSLLAGGYAAVLASDTGSRTLYPLTADGVPDTSQPGVVAALGTGVYLAGLSAAAALIGALMLRKTARDVASDRFSEEETR